MPQNLLERLPLQYFDAPSPAVPCQAMVGLSVLYKPRLMVSLANCYDLLYGSQLVACLDTLNYKPGLGCHTKPKHSLTQGRAGAKAPGRSRVYSEPLFGLALCVNVDTAGTVGNTLEMFCSCLRDNSGHLGCKPEGIFSYPTYMEINELCKKHSSPSISVGIVLPI